MLDYQVEPTCFYPICRFSDYATRRGSPKPGDKQSNQATDHSGQMPYPLPNPGLLSSHWNTAGRGGAARYDTWYEERGKSRDRQREQSRSKGREHRESRSRIREGPRDDRVRASSWDARAARSKDRERSRSRRRCVSRDERRHNKNTRESMRRADSRDERTKSKDEDRHKSRRTKEESSKEERGYKKEEEKKKEEKGESDDDSDSYTSDDEDVEERYCRLCEIALAKCRPWDVPVSGARLDAQIYFMKPPVCIMHYHKKDVVKDDKIITLENLWKEMKAKEPCGRCDAARKSARPLPEPYDKARTEGEKYFSPRPFCVLHQKRGDVLYDEELVSVKRFWKRMKRMERKQSCFACEGLKKWCRPLRVPNNRAFTEGERWFHPSPLCLRHRERRKIVEGGEMVKMEDYWKIWMEAEKKEVEKREEVQKVQRRSESRRGDSMSSEDRGRSRNAEEAKARSSRAANLLSPDVAIFHGQQWRGRPRSTMDSFRESSNTGREHRRRPRSVDVSQSYESNRKSRSPSPYPPDWTEDQREKYLEGFRTLGQPRQEQESVIYWAAEFPLPPPAQENHQSPPGMAAFYDQASPTPPAASQGCGNVDMTSKASADFLSSRSAMSESYRDMDRDRDSYSDESGNSLADERDQQQDTRSLVEKLGLSPVLAG